MNNQTEAERQIADDLIALGVRPGGVLLVHASLRSLGKVTGGAETVVRGLLRALEENGTLLMPALTYRYTTVTTPVFDLQNTPSCVGALPEFFRTRANTTRSIHPTHSVSGVGALAERILEDHYLDVTPCGIHSPFYRLREENGQILFLGCGLRPNTSMHAVEEIVEPPYLFGQPVDYRIILSTDTEMTMRVKRHDFWKWKQRYDRLGPLLDNDGLRFGRNITDDFIV